MKKFIYIWCLLSVFICATPGFGQLKLAVYNTSPVISQQLFDQPHFRPEKFGLIIIDLDNWVNNPGSIMKIKEVNGKAKVLVYSNPFEVYHKPMAARPLNQKLTALMMNKGGKHADWWLWTTKRQNIVFYSSLPYWVMNMSSNCPLFDGQRWNQFIADFYAQDVLTKEPRPDGWFMDNSTADIFWVNKACIHPKDKTAWIDADLDGQPDREKDLDAAWQKGQSEFVEWLRSRAGKKFLVVGNKGKPEYWPGLFDGKMFEHFPFDYAGEDKRAGGWYQCMANASQTGPLTIIQAQWPTTPDKFNFVLASALLADAYFCVGHNQWRWFPEYDAADRLGAPTSGIIAEDDSVWSREFVNGQVKVWPNIQKGEIILKP